MVTALSPFLIVRILKVLFSATGGPPLRRKNGSRKTPNSLRGNLNKNRTTAGNCVLNKNQISKQSCREIHSTGRRLTGGPPV